MGKHGHTAGVSPPGFASNAMNRIKGIDVMRLRTNGHLPGSGISAQGNAKWMRGLKWIGRAGGAAGGSILEMNTERSYCRFVTPDSDGCSGE